MSFDHNILISHELQLVEKETPNRLGFQPHISRKLINKISKQRK